MFLGKMRALLANLGFVLQISGIFIVIPIILSFINNELVATVAFFITATIFLVIGFAFNVFCERRELSYKSSCALFVLVFVFLSLIGSIPYMYVNFSNGDIIQNISDSIFEAASGFTTTGFSVIPNISALPESIIFYRAMTQFIGGIGIVLVLLAFFYPEAKLKDFAKSLGVSTDQKIKKTFFLILLVYCFYTSIFVIMSITLGYRDIVKAISFVFSAISTGGFTPINDITSVATTFPMNIVLVISMVLGASNFFIIAGLFKRRFKQFFISEFSVFFIMAIIAISVTSIFFGLSAQESIFHIVSGMTNSGFSYVSVAEFTDGLKFFLVFLMLVGGASFSTAGGFKIFRFVLMLKSVRKVIYESITGREYRIKLFGREYSNANMIQAVVIVLLFIGVVFFSAFIVSSYGFPLVDSLFETTSGTATTGLSTGIINPSLKVELKWLFVCLMILGRVEILVVFMMFSRTKKPSIQNEENMSASIENDNEKKQITKQFKCPKCGTIVTISGQSGENLTVTCSSCGTKGILII
ncbi:hypothetical protein AYK25_00540 [Thermoplasmatales archaeon SM1-50]|nr:MAG: hypothetical protein AYK25_00540 [Thermoplasmatales archaeon SM1-50]